MPALYEAPVSLNVHTKLSDIKSMYLSYNYSLITINTSHNVCSSLQDQIEMAQVIKLLLKLPVSFIIFTI